MALNLPALIVTLPVLLACIQLLVGKASKERYAAYLMLTTQFLILILSAALTWQAYSRGDVYYVFGNWSSALGIELKASPFSSLVCFLVQFIAFMSSLFSLPMLLQNARNKIAEYSCLTTLFLASLNGMTLTNDAFNIYVFLEVSALTSYSLIALGGGRGYLASFRYLLLGSLGGVLYLLGVGLLFSQYGTLNIQLLGELLLQHDLTYPATFAFIAIVVGFLIKSAQFPMHGWMTPAYRTAPTAVALSLAPLATKLAILVLIKVTSSLFPSPAILAKAPMLSNMLIIFACLGIVAGTWTALGRRDLGHILGALIVAEAGYMTGGLFMLNQLGRQAAAFHLLHDAVVTAILFMVLGIIRWHGRRTRVANFTGMAFSLPVATFGLLFAAIAVIGLPPTSGFFSKMFLIRAAIASGHWEFVLCLLFASIGFLSLFVRILEQAFTRVDPDKTYNEPVLRVLTEEEPKLMQLALGVMIGFSLALGIGFYTIMETFIAPSLGGISL